MTSVGVVCESSSRAALAKEISARLDAPFFLGVPLASFDFILAVTDERVELRSGAEDGVEGGIEAMGPVFVDFVGGAIGYRLKKSQGPDLILRAVGGPKAKVLDLTAGLASDAFVLAGYGCHVTAVERSAIVSCLVEDALRRASCDPRAQEICGRLNLINDDAIQFLEKNTVESWDSIYIDPMFPEKKKSSLPKKGLRLLQNLVGTGDENESRKLLMLARKRAGRVVVKRPVGAPALLPGAVSTIKGRSVRFDIYKFS